LLSHIVRVNGGSKWVVGYHGDRLQLAPNVDRPWLIEIGVATLVHSSAFNIDWSIWGLCWDSWRKYYAVPTCPNLSHCYFTRSDDTLGPSRCSWLVVPLSHGTEPQSLYMDCILLYAMVWFDIYISIEFWVVPWDNGTTKQRHAKRVKLSQRNQKSLGTGWDSLGQMGQMGQHITDGE